MTSVLFISRCGTPTKVVSDHFKNFKSNEIEAYFKQIEKNRHGGVVSTKVL